MNPPPNQNQGPTIAKISVEPRVWFVDVAIITHRGAMTIDDGPITQVQLVGKKRVQFDIDDERDTFFEAHDAIRRDPGKLSVYEMPPFSYSTLVVGPSWKHGTFQNFFESCLSLEKYPDVLAEIAILLHRP